MILRFRCLFFAPASSMSLHPREQLSSVGTKTKSEKTAAGWSLSYLLQPRRHRGPRAAAFFSFVRVVLVFFSQDALIFGATAAAVCAENPAATNHHRLLAGEDSDLLSLPPARQSSSLEGEVGSEPTLRSNRESSISEGLEGLEGLSLLSLRSRLSMKQFVGQRAELEAAAALAAREDTTLTASEQAVASAILQAAAHKKVHSRWLSEHSSLILEAKRTQGVLENNFILAQNQSKRACSARLLHSKDELSRLLHEVMEVSSEVKGQQEIMRSESQDLDASVASISMQKERWQRVQKKCLVDAATSEQEKQRLNKELETLGAVATTTNQIAKTSQIVKATAAELSHPLKPSADVDKNNKTSSEEASALTGLAQSDLSVASSPAAPSERLTHSASEKRIFEALDTVDKILPHIEVEPQSQKTAAVPGAASKVAAHSQGRPDHSPGPALANLLAISSVLSSSSSLGEQEAECKAYLEALLRRNRLRRGGLVSPEGDEDGIGNGEQEEHNLTSPPKSCSEQLGKLGETLETTTGEIESLIEDATKRSEEMSHCVENAKAQETAELMPLMAQRQEIAQRVEAAAKRLKAVEPTMQRLRERSKDLELYIEKKLTPECKEAKAAGEHLNQVRQLIESLKRCTGKDGFGSLKKPAAAAAAGPPVAPTNSSQSSS